MRPDKFLDIESLVLSHLVFALDFIPNHEHLQIGSEVCNWVGANDKNLTYIGYFEHLLPVQCFLRFNNTWQVNQLGRVEVISYAKNSSARIWERDDRFTENRPLGILYTFKLEPDIIPDVPRRNCLPQFLTILPRWHSEYKLLFKRQILFVRI